jgi:hypothetical protein
VFSTLRPHLTYANVMASIAVFIALGGTSVAAASLSKNSVGSSQIRNSSLTGKDVKNSSLTTSDVKNRSLLAKDFRTGQLPMGARGATGPQGPAGPQGASGATNVVVRTTSQSIAGFATGRVNCQAGERATGGGATRSPYMGTPQSGNGDSSITGPYLGARPASAGETPDGWGGQITAPSGTFVFYVVCARP